jgi:hypothetical protein
VPTVPKALIDLGSGVVILFLMAVVVYLILQIIKAVKASSRLKTTDQQADDREVERQRRPPCFYLEGSINERSAVTRIEENTKANRELLAKVGGTMDRLVISSDKQVDLLQRLVQGQRQ